MRSYRGKSNISKKGNSYLRNLLYMSALTAARLNKQCKLLYERLLSKGKTKKEALIAVLNKLVRQIFAVVKHGVKYDPDNGLGMERN